MISIRTKLSLWLTGLLVIGTVIGLILFESMLRQAFHDSIINRLEEDSNILCWQPISTMGTSA